MKREWKETMTRMGKTLGKFKYPILILILGVVLISIPTKSQDSKLAKAPETADASPADEKTETTDEQETLEQLESELEELLSQVEGAGDVRVMLRYAASPRTVYQTDSTQEVRSGTEENETTTDVRTVLASDGSSKENAVAVQVMSATFQGAVVVAQGADDAQVKLNLVSAVSSLTGLGTDKITVIKMKSE
jgi:stage III sporulation protein AG